MNQPIQWHAPLKTIKGHKAKYLGPIKFNGAIHALVMVDYSDDDQGVTVCDVTTGQSLRHSSGSVVNVPEETVGYFNVYQQSMLGTVHATREACDVAGKANTTKPLATYKLTTREDGTHSLEPVT